MSRDPGHDFEAGIARALAGCGSAGCRVRVAWPESQRTFSIVISELGLPGRANSGSQSEPQGESLRAIRDSADNRCPGIRADFEAGMARALKGSGSAGCRVPVGWPESQRTFSIVISELGLPGHVNSGSQSEPQGASLRAIRNSIRRFSVFEGLRHCSTV